MLAYNLKGDRIWVAKRDFGFDPGSKNDIIPIRALENNFRLK